jgi:enoyl-CoA hydratase
MDQEGPPRLVRTGQLAEIQLRRPSVHNRLDPDDVMLVGAMLEDLTKQLGPRLVTFTASGRSFCSGINLKALGPGRSRAASADAALALFERLPDMIEALPMPTLFVLNGPVYGGAIDLVLAGCFRIGHPSSTFSVAAPSRGALYSPSGIVRAVGQLGPGAAKRLFMLGQTLTAADLLGLGVLDEIAEGEAAIAKAVEIAHAVCAKGPLPIAAAKRIINDAAVDRFDPDAAKVFRDEIARSADLAEGMAAWRDRRPPVFTGR